MNKGLLTALCLAVLMIVPACCWRTCEPCGEPCGTESCVPQPNLCPETVCSEECVPVQAYRKVKCCTTTTKKCGPVEFECPCPEEIGMISNGQLVKKGTPVRSNGGGRVSRRGRY